MLYSRAIRAKIKKYFWENFYINKTNANVNSEPNTKRFFEENVESNFVKVEHRPFLPRRRQHISKRLSLVLKV